MQATDDLGRLIEKARAQRGFTLRHLGDLSGVDFKVISRIETGKTTRPHKTTLAALAPHLRLDLDDLLDALERNGSSEEVAS